MTWHGYINNHKFLFIGPILMIETFENLPSLDHGSPEIATVIVAKIV